MIAFIAGVIIGAAVAFGICLYLGRAEDMRRMQDARSFREFTDEIAAHYAAERERRYSQTLN